MKSPRAFFCLVVAWNCCVVLSYSATGLNSRAVGVRYLSATIQHTPSLKIDDGALSVRRGLRTEFSTFRKSILDRISQKIPLPTRTMMSYIWPKSSASDVEYNNGKNIPLLVALSMVAMFLGKWFNLQVPLILQKTVDAIAFSSSSVASSSAAGNAVFMSIILYGFSRALSVIFSEIKTCLFIHVSQSTLRKFANRIFKHLHSLDNDFHLKTPSGVVSSSLFLSVSMSVSLFLSYTSSFEIKIPTTYHLLPTTLFSTNRYQ